MRIRSIRPEFWASEDIAALSWETRLIYIGLWSYADDNGVGRDNEALIAAALFPLDVDLPESSRRTHVALKALFEGGQIARYEVSGRRYFHITAWETHQKINNKSEGRYPLPTCKDSGPHVALPEPSRSPQPEVALGEGEKGRRGEGEKGVLRGENPDAQIVVAHDEVTAQTIVAEWIDHCRERPPSRVIGQLSREVAALIADDIDPAKVRAGTAAWATKGLHPSTLASVVHETMNGTNGRRSTTDNRVGQALDLAAEYERAGK